MPSRDTRLELIVRRWFYRNGIRFRTRNRDLPGSPDIANRRRQWAVFVHGCFWHAHGCRPRTIPGTNTSYWESKFARNRERDALAVAALKGMGYKVATVWECEVATGAAFSTELFELVGGRGSPLPPQKSAGWPRRLSKP